MAGEGSTCNGVMSRIPRDATGPWTSKALRPKDASTLILIDRSGDEPRVLMGRRSTRHAFKPGAHVFPGGRVDPADSRVCVANDYRSDVADLLDQAIRRNKTTTRRRAHGIAAIRETMEEAGLMIGAPGQATNMLSGTLSGKWGPFGDAGLLPDLSRLALVARAITPPGQNRRFDTRFFCAFRDDCLDATSHGYSPSDELADLEWVTFDESKSLNLPGITEYVLDVLAQRWAFDPTFSQPTSIPFFEAPRGKPTTRLLTALI